MIRLALALAVLLEPPMIPKGSRVFIQPIDNGFENYLAAAIQKKAVPLTMVTRREAADYEISVSGESESASQFDMWLTGTAYTKEDAAITVRDLKTKDVVFVFKVKRTMAPRGKLTSAEACAKALGARVGS